MNSTDQEITLKDLFLKIGDFYREIKEYYKLVILSVVICLCVFGYKHLTYEPFFESKLRFVVEGESGTGGGLSSLLGSFGIKKGGNVNPYKVVEVARSNKILKQLLQQKTSYNDLLGNELIMEYRLQEKWGANNPVFDTFKFSVNSFDQEALYTDLKAIKEIKKLVYGSAEDMNKAITTISYNIDTGIYSIESKAKTENISLLLTTGLFNEIKDFFEVTVFTNQKQLTDILTAKTDSLKDLRDSMTRQLAIFEDRNTALINRESQVKKTLLSQESFALNNAYGELLKNKEMADVNLKDIQPLFLAIDLPFSPIAPSRSSLSKSIIFGLFFGCFLSILYIILRKIYRDTMSS